MPAGSYWIWIGLASPQTLCTIAPIIFAEMIATHPEQLTGPQRRSRNGVICERRVRIEINSRVRLLIKRRCQHSSWASRATTCNIDVQTEWIILCAIERAATVTGDNFMSEDVVACFGQPGS